MTEAALSRACERARLDASLALDGALAGQVELEALWHHLGACAACAAFAAELGHATTLVRTKPLEPVRLELTGPRLARARMDGRRGPWTSVAVVLVAAILGTTQLSGLGREAPERGPATVTGAEPVRLPIGQRSAAEDFAVGLPLSLR
ncbi:MAG TPA: hypothetical protein VFN99_02780 [Gaiella sp.]|nr:hypothetical protein [Gaiella sp.]